MKKKTQTKSKNVAIESKSKEKPEKRQEAPYPHFRRYKKTNHPAFIVGEQINDRKKEEYKFRKVMHSPRDGRHLNERVEPNPNPADKKPMYIAKLVRHDEKQRFAEKPLPWQYRRKEKKDKKSNVPRAIAH